MQRLQDKIAIITGSSHGIGEGIARLFAEEGAKVVLAARTLDRLEAVAQSIRGVGGTAAVVQTDVSRTDDIRHMIEVAVAEYGGVDVVVNNAGIGGFRRRLGDEDMEQEYDRLMATNVKSAWMSTHYALPHLKARGGGSIIHIASVHAIATYDHQSAYAASKGALVAGARGMALELAADQIRVNCISPGCIYLSEPGEWIKNRFGPELYTEFMERFGDAEARGRTLQQALPVAGHPRDIAYTAVYLASDEARFVTGANFVIDGGATAALHNPVHVSQDGLDTKARREAIRAWMDEARQR